MQGLDLGSWFVAMKALKMDMVEDVWGCPLPELLFREGQRPLVLGVASPALYLSLGISLWISVGSMRNRGSRDHSFDPTGPHILGGVRQHLAASLMFLLALCSDSLLAGFRTI